MSDSEEEIESQIFSYEEIPKEEFISPGSKACPGCGPLLGLRLALKIIGNEIKEKRIKSALVVSNGPCARLIGSTVQIPFVVVDTLGKIPIQEEMLVLYDQNGNIDELIEFFDNNDLFLAISYNDKKNLARIANDLNIEYIATACVSYPLDYLNKVKRALRHKKAFIQLFAPCPVQWGFDHSNTIEIGKSAVMSGIFPLFEIREKEFLLTFRPKMLEPIKLYLESQKRFSHMREEEKEEEQKKITKNWKAMESGRFWQSE